MPNGTAQIAMSPTCAGLAAAGHPAPVAEPDRDDDAGDDAQRVGAERERAEVPDALRGAGDGQWQRSRSGHVSSPARGSRRSGARAMSSASLAAEVPSVHRIGTVPSGGHAEDRGAVGDLVAAGGQLRPFSTATWTGSASVDDAVERPGEPLEGGVEPVEVVPQRRRVVAGRVGGDEPDRDLVGLARRRAGPARRRGRPSRPGRCRGTWCSRRRPASAASSSSARMSKGSPGGVGQRRPRRQV